MPDDAVESADLEKCRYCSGITLARLASEHGYWHASSRTSLMRSARRCRLCSLLFRKDRSRQSSLQLRLSLEKLSDDDPQVVLNISHVDGSGAVSKGHMFMFLYAEDCEYFPSSPGEISDQAVGDPAATIFGITLKQKLSSTNSEATFNTIRQWLRDCGAHHSCLTPLPLRDQEQAHAARLLDLEAFPAPDSDIRLLDNDSVPKRYATLSYCWGKSRSFTTTTKSLPHRQQRIDFETLPRTFKDAIHISRKLGIRWIWIDACCIVQDSLLDWQTESSKMGAIYSNAYLTIASDSGTDSSGGCYNDESTTQELIRNNAPFELNTTVEGVSPSSVYVWDPSRGPRRPTPPEIDESPLSERGWVCQERILSARILHYTKSQLFWECRDALLAEDGLRPWSLLGDSETVPGLAKHLYGTTADLQSRLRLLDVWYQNVLSQSYSRRKLTRPADKLTAISGTASAFQRHFRTRYVAGLWEFDLLFGLCWRRRGPVAHPAVYRAPSFSWASLDAIIEWPVRSAPTNSKVEIRDIDITLQSEDPHGPISDGFMVIKAPLRKALVTAQKRISAGTYDLTWELRTHSNKLLGTAWMDSNEIPDAPRRVNCILLSEGGKSQAILLEHTSDEAKDEMGVYVRKGIAEVLGFDRDDPFFGAAQEMEITLV